MHVTLSYIAMCNEHRSLKITLSNILPPTLYHSHLALLPRFWKHLVIFLRRS